jgi:hypothetical protein
MRVGLYQKNAEDGPSIRRLRVCCVKQNEPVARFLDAHGGDARIRCVRRPVQFMQPRKTGSPQVVERRGNRMHWSYGCGMWWWVVAWPPTPDSASRRIARVGPASPPSSSGAPPRTTAPNLRSAARRWSGHRRCRPTRHETPEDRRVIVKNHPCGAGDAQPFHRLLEALRWQQIGWGRCSFLESTPDRATGRSGCDGHRIPSDGRRRSSACSRPTPAPVRICTRDSHVRSARADP